MRWKHTLGRSFRFFAIVALLWNVALFAADGNSAYFLGDEDEASNARWDLLASETKEITAVVHIWEVNKLGLAGLAGLRAAAQKGAKVRLVIDGFGAQFWNPQSAFYPEIVTALKNSGVDVRVYNPIPGATSLLATGSLNRMHHKLIYFGSKNLALSGDRNFQNDNFPGGRAARDGKRTNSYKSMETLVAGPAAMDSRAYAEQMWAASKQLPESTDAEKVAREIEKLDRVRGVMESADHTPQDWVAKLKPVKDVSFLGDAPRISPHDDTVTAGIVDTINNAKENIRMTVPFNLFDLKIERALVLAARRGVKIDLLLPSERSRNMADTFALGFRSQGRRLTIAGAKLHEFDSDKWLHAKVIQVDGTTTFVGTHNFNPRSVKTDLESGWIVTDEQYGKGVAEYFDEIVRTQSVPYVPRRLSFMETCRVGFLQILLRVPRLGDQF